MIPDFRNKRYEKCILLFIMFSFAAESFLRYLGKFVDWCCHMCYNSERHQKTEVVGSNRDYNEKKNVHGTGGRSHRSQYGGGSRKRRTENTE